MTTLRVKSVFKQYPLFYLFCEGGLKSSFLLFGCFALSVVASFCEGMTFLFLTGALTTLGGQAAGFSLVFLSYFAAFSFGSLFLFAIGSQVIRSISAVFAQCLANALLVRYQGHVQAEIFRKTFSFTFAHVSTYRAGELAEYLNLPNIAFRHIVDEGVQGLLAFAAASVLVGFLWMLSPALTLCGAILFGITAYLYRKVLQRIGKFSEEYSQANASFVAHIHDRANGIRLIHYFDHAKTAFVNFSHALTKFLKTYRNLSNAYSFFISFSETVAILQVAIILILGMAFLNGDSGGAPVLLAYIGATYRLAVRAQRVFHASNTIALYSGHCKRLNAFLRDEDKSFVSSEGICKDAVQEMISFDRVSFRYAGRENNVLNNISFSVSVGQTVALVGVSGSGKSTVLDLLMRLYEPTGGHIWIDGIELDTINLSSWRSKIGIVNQDIFLFPDTVEQNLLLGKHNATREQMELASQRAGAHAFIRALPQGYQTVIGERGMKLSGGERQRLAIARALIRDPQILVFDEATSHLDSEMEGAVQECLEKLQHQKTMLIVAHRLSTVRSADLICVLDEGRILERGTHAELLAKGGKYAELWHLQMMQGDEIASC